ncbi:MAG: hypothetical protein KAS32_13305 [Candidatus Peribacteraceae bacterium]|nr:hypothetical protein [Candidatus Peribacteraceae bacterium]
MNEELKKEITEWHEYLESFDPVGPNSMYAKFGGIASYFETVAAVKRRVKKLYELTETE